MGSSDSWKFRSLTAEKRASTHGQINKIYNFGVVASFFPPAAHLRHPRRSQTYFSLCPAPWIESWCIFSRSLIAKRFSIMHLATCFIAWVWNFSRRRLLRLPPPLLKNKYMFHARPLMHQIISLITAEANNDAIQDDKTQSAWGYDSALKNFNKTRAPLTTRSKAYYTTYCGAGFFSKASLFAPVSNHSSHICLICGLGRKFTAPAGNMLLELTIAIYSNGGKL